MLFNDRKAQNTYYQIVSHKMKASAGKAKGVAIMKSKRIFKCVVCNQGVRRSKSIVHPKLRGRCCVKHTSGGTKS